MRVQETYFKVCINEVKASAIHGCLYTILERQPFEFHDFQQLLLHIDQLLDQAGRPQSSFQKRSFVEDMDAYGYQFTPKKEQAFDEFKDIEGLLTTFYIDIQSRHHGAWQGVCIFSKQQHLAFNSDLELLHIFEKLANVYQ